MEDQLDIETRRSITILTNAIICRRHDGRVDCISISLALNGMHSLLIRRKIVEVFGSINFVRNACINFVDFITGRQGTVKFSSVLDRQY